MRHDTQLREYAAEVAREAGADEHRLDLALQVADYVAADCSNPSDTDEVREAICRAAVLRAMGGVW